MCLVFSSSHLYCYTSRHLFPLIIFLYPFLLIIIQWDIYYFRCSGFINVHLVSSFSHLYCYTPQLSFPHHNFPPAYTFASFLFSSLTNSLLPTFLVSSEQRLHPCRPVRASFILLSFLSSFYFPSTVISRFFLPFLTYLFFLCPSLLSLPSVSYFFLSLRTFSSSFPSFPFLLSHISFCRSLPTFSSSPLLSLPPVSYFFPSMPYLPFLP